MQDFYADMKKPWSGLAATELYKTSLPWKLSWSVLLLLKLPHLVGRKSVDIVQAEPSKAQFKTLQKLDEIRFSELLPKSVWRLISTDRTPVRE